MAILELKPLRSRLGRRLLLLFAATALVPLTVLGTLSMLETQRQIVDQEHKNLRQETKNVAMQLLAKLERLDIDLALVAEGPAARSSTGDTAAAGHLRDWARQHFRSLSWVDGQGRLTAVVGVGPDAGTVEAVRRRAFADETNDSLAALHAIADDGGQSRVFISRRVRDGLMLGETHPAALWAFPLPDSVDLCVLTKSASLLFCSENVPLGLQTRVLEAARRQSTGYFDWEGDAGTLNAHFWTMPSGGRYFESPVTFVLAARTSEAGARLRGFQYVYVLTAAASLIAIVLVSISQIRRYTKPLQALRDGALRVGERDFSRPVAVTSKDEFGEVAQAFNGMTARVRNLLGTLRTLAAIDGVILSAIDRPSMIESLLSMLPTVFPSHAVGFGLLPSVEQGGVVLQHRRAKGDGSGKTEEYEASQALHAILEKGAPVWLDPDEMRDAGLGAMLDDAALKGLLAPIAYREGAAAFLAWTFAGENGDASIDVSVAADLAERAAVALRNAEHEEHLYHRANYDSLTSLPNRELMRTRLEHAIARCRSNGTALGVMFVDLDRFKSINDTLGHALGDELLVTLAGRLQLVTQEPSFVARFGGDEFIVVAPDLGRAPQEALSRLAADVLAATAEPVLLADIPHRVTTSIGMTLYPEDAKTVEGLLMNADAAMYEAKAAGRDTARRYQERIGATIRERHQIENGLRTAVENDELEVVYQPKVDLVSGDPVGAEALIRWNSPVLGRVSPARFIEIAEESDLILGIGAWTLKRACEQAVDWRAGGTEALTVAVNASVRQLRDEGFVDTVRQVLLDTGLPPRNLHIEVTESAVMNDVDQVAKVLLALSKLEVGIAIDDFGTGYSSLAYLAELPIHVLKIDQSFTRRMVESERIASIVRAILDLAQNLDLNVVAEGIESTMEHEMLMKLGCQVGQGYYFGKPMSARNLDAYFAAGVEA